MDVNIGTGKVKWLAYDKVAYKLLGVFVQLDFLDMGCADE